MVLEVLLLGYLYVRKNLPAEALGWDSSQGHMSARAFQGLAGILFFLGIGWFLSFKYFQPLLICHVHRRLGQMTRNQQCSGQYLLQQVHCDFPSSSGQVWDALCSTTPLNLANAPFCVFFLHSRKKDGGHAANDCPTVRVTVTSLRLRRRRTAR